MIAEFEGMLDPKYRKTVIAKGPFIVEVFENPDRPKYFRARIIPTHQEFFRFNASGKMVPIETTAAECRIAIEHRFQKKLKDWQEPNVTERPQENPNGKQ
jgi:hypothetical protein